MRNHFNIVGNSPLPQLYHLKNDIAEKDNLASQYPVKVKEMAGQIWINKNTWIMKKVETYSIISFMVSLFIISCGKPKEHVENTGNPPGIDTTSTGNTDPGNNDNNGAFALFHLVRYNNTPSDLMPYLHPTKIANESMLLNADGSPNINAIKNFANTCEDRIPVTLDLETWPYYPQAELDKTVGNFLAVIKAFRSANTHSPIGFYGVPPKQAYEWKNIDPVNNPSGYGNWLYINNALAPVAANVQIFLPSFYAYDPDTTSWRKMVDATVAAIKKYGPDRPIYAYIWPQYHQGSSPYNLQYIDTVIWRYQLQVMYDRVNGCIIWTSNKDSQGNWVSWDPNMPWWQVTKSFLVDKGLVPPFVLDSLYANQSGNSVKVNWATSTDATTNYFVIQRGADTTHFQNISDHISSISTHYTENVYAFTDDNPVSNKNYYRLMMVDDKNNKTYSKTISTP